jgi:hypothetical protein
MKKLMDSNENLYKNPGELERSGFEPLPPTELSHEAREKLENWGLASEQIDHLQQHTSQFRYDLCPQKVDRLSQNKAEIFTRDGKEFVNLPTFFDVEGRLDGQCSDIARQWIIQINESDLIDELNAHRIDDSRIVTCYYTGNSKTHFCKEDSNHVWNGLAIVEGDDVIDEIYFDAAFQAIMSKPESGYTQKTALFDAKGVEINENIDIPIGWVEIGESSWSGNVSGMAVLGVSRDFQYSFLLGFVRDQTQAILPIVGKVDAAGECDYFFYGENSHVLEREPEVREILDSARKIELEKKEPTINRINWTHREFSQDR